MEHKRPIARQPAGRSVPVQDASSYTRTDPRESLGTLPLAGFWDVRIWISRIVSSQVRRIFPVCSGVSTGAVSAGLLKLTGSVSLIGSTHAGGPRPLDREGCAVTAGDAFSLFAGGYRRCVCPGLTSRFARSLAFQSASPELSLVSPKHQGNRIPANVFDQTLSCLGAYMLGKTNVKDAAYPRLVFLSRGGKSTANCGLGACRNTGIESGFHGV